MAARTKMLQSLEVGIDPAHTSFLHRFFHDEDPAQGYGKLFGDTSIDSLCSSLTIAAGRISVLADTRRSPRQ
jgi:hypothetical protein